MTEKRIVPAVDWETEANHSERLVWWDRIDGRFPVEVHRLDEQLAKALDMEQDLYDPLYEGVLCIFDHYADDELVFVEKVGLYYGALFGPDAEDVHAWKQKIIEYIDNELPKRRTQG